jgi:hypothetical protein
VRCDSDNRPAVAPHAPVQETRVEHYLVALGAALLRAGERGELSSLGIHDGRKRRELHWRREGLLYVGVVWDDAVTKREHLEGALRPEQQHATGVSITG